MSIDIGKIKRFRLEDDAVEAVGDILTKSIVCMCDCANQETVSRSDPAGMQMCMLGISMHLSLLGEVDHGGS